MGGQLREGDPRGADLELEERHAFVVQLLPPKPMFVLPTIATEVFHLIYLLFISLQLPKRKAGRGETKLFEILTR